ncbi:PadR family transcriptional regulator [Plantactinospora siamensis]|uniref:PadR family transcriptional regulator n=1 Tax=Plantactinospora siamensis TaxID=555372 RepID=A0ABV6NV64_9ACTN
MPARPLSSAQTRAVIAALHSHPAPWRYGYDMARETGLASGTLYPILGRLADRGLVETSWEEDAPTGRPRRHLYRLTAEGARLAAELGAAPQRTSPAGQARVRPSTGEA